MKQRIFLFALVAAVIGALWWGLSDGSDGDGPADHPVAEREIDRAAIIARKLQARDGGAIDLSPCRALGRVTESGGRGVSGAMVLLTPKGLNQLSRSMTPGEAAAPLRVRADADGQWSLAGLRPGRYALSASAPGFLPATRTDITLRAGQDNAGLHLTLVAGGHTVKGTVSDIGGGPVEDVLVRVIRLDVDSPFNFDRASIGAATDEEGRFVLQLTDGLYSLTTYHPDYVEASKSVRVDGGPRALALTVTPAGSIEGRVLDRATGEPVEGAIVTRSSDPNGGFVVLGLGDDQVVSDAEGRFSMRGLSSGVARLSAVARGYATRQPVEVVLGVAEQHDDVEILVDPALTISGFVVARGDEERGLEGVLVGAYSVQPGRLQVATGPSASDGYFEIFGVMPGSYTVAAIGEDALPNLVGAQATVEREDVRDVLVVMDGGVHVRGRVTPAVPASVSVQIDSEGLSMATMLQSISNALVRGRTGKDGTFDLHPVAEGSLTVVAEADDGSRGRVELTVDTRDVDGLVISLEPRAQVAGRVVDAAGEPEEGLTVVFRNRTPSPGEGLSLGLHGLGGVQRSATTDDRGEFMVRGLDAGDYDVAVTPARGPALVWAEPVDPDKPQAPMQVTVEEAERREGLVLTVEARDGVITGVVVGPEGEPVADAWVTAARTDSTAMLGAAAPSGVQTDAAADEQREQQLQQFGMDFLAEPPVLTDAEGRFEVRELRAGTYRVRAEAHGEGARGYVDDVAVGSDVRIAMLPLAGLSGIVQFGGAPVEEYTIETQGPARRSTQVYASDGRFSMERLDPGDYVVIARSGDGTVRENVELSEGQTASIELTIGGWSGLRGEVVDAATGDPIEGLTISVMGDGGFSNGSVMGVFAGTGPTTDDDGSFAVDEVPPGRGTILFFDRDAAGVGGEGVVARAEYDVEPEQEQDLGSIIGVAPIDIPPDERGTLGLTVVVATYAERPRAPGAQDDPEEAAFDLSSRLWVRGVLPAGPAALEGLVPGDEILSVHGRRVLGIGATNAAKLLSPRYLQVEDEVPVQIEHDGMRHPVTIVAEPALEVF